MKNYLIVTLIVMLTVTVGCEKTSNLCEEEKITAAFVFEYPDTVVINSAFTLGIKYVVENSCGDFGKFDVVKADNTLEVSLTTYYKGCSCVDEFEEREVSYPITFNEAGTYELKFWVAEDEFESYVVVAV